MKLFNRKPRQTNTPTENAFNTEGCPINLTVQVSNSTGKTRNHMEDAVFSLCMDVRASESRYVMGLFMVADGMGGHMHGEAASNLAIQVTSGSLLKTIVEPLRLGQKTFTSQEMEEALVSAVQAAQDAIVAQVAGGGTTLTAALVLDKDLHFAHIGDSRLYLETPTRGLEVLTQDHSLVRRLVELHQISPEEAGIHPQRNVLFRALGQLEGFKVDVGHVHLEGPSSLVLCSDGLWGQVPDQEILKVVRQASNAGRQAQRLVDMANEAGGTDNISVIVVNIT